MHAVRRVLDYSEYALVAVCVVSFAVMFVLGVATVVFRFLLEASLTFPDELIRYLFVWVIFLGSAVALRRNVHAAIGVFVDLLPRAPKRLVEALVAGLSGAFFAILLVKGVQLSLRAAPQISPALEVSMAWAYAAVPAGALFMLIYTIELFASQILDREAEPPASDTIGGGN